MKARTSIRILAAAAALLPMGAAADELPGNEAPDFALKSVAGDQLGDNLRLSEYRGEVVLLSFWASWCGRCREQLAALGGIEARYGDAGLRLLSVSLDAERRRAADAARAVGVDYPILHDSAGSVGELYQIDALPSLVLIDRYGVVRDVFEGAGARGERAWLEPMRALLRE